MVSLCRWGILRVRAFILAETGSEREWRSKAAKELARNQVKFNSRATTCSLNLALSLSKEEKAFRVCGGRQSFCSLRVRDKNSFGHSNISFFLKEGYLDEKFENSKLVRVCCKISNL